MGKLRRSLRIHCWRKSRSRDSSQPKRAVAKEHHTASGPHHRAHGTCARPSKKPSTADIAVGANQVGMTSRKVVSQAGRAWA